MSSEGSSERSQQSNIPGNPATVAQILVVTPTDGMTTVYDGDFPFLRDGRSFEITVPLGTTPAVGGVPLEEGPLPDVAIETVPDGEGPLTEGVPEEIVIAATEEQVIASGVITVVALHGENVVIVVDDPRYIDPLEVDIHE